MRYLVESSDCQGGYGNTIYYITDGEKQRDRVFRCGTESYLNTLTSTMTKVMKKDSVAFGYGPIAWEITEEEEAQIVAENANPEKGEAKVTEKKDVNNVTDQSNKSEKSKKIAEMLAQWDTPEEKAKRKIYMENHNLEDFDEDF